MKTLFTSVLLNLLLAFSLSNAFSAQRRKAVGQSCGSNEECTTRCCTPLPETEATLTLIGLCGEKSGTVNCMNDGFEARHPGIFSRVQQLFRRERQPKQYDAKYQFKLPFARPKQDIVLDYPNKRPNFKQSPYSTEVAPTTSILKTRPWLYRLPPGVKAGLVPYGDHNLFTTQSTENVVGAKLGTQSSSQFQAIAANRDSLNSSQTDTNPTKQLELTTVLSESSTENFLTTDGNDTTAGIIQGTAEMVTQQDLTSITSSAIEQSTVTEEVSDTERVSDVPLVIAANPFDVETEDVSSTFTDPTEIQETGLGQIQETSTGFATDFENMGTTNKPSNSSFPNALAEGGSEASTLAATGASTDVGNQSTNVIFQQASEAPEPALNPFLDNNVAASTSQSTDSNPTSDSSSLDPENSTSSSAVHTGNAQPTSFESSTNTNNPGTDSIVVGQETSVSFTFMDDFVPSSELPGNVAGSGNMGSGGENSSPLEVFSSEAELTSPSSVAANVEPSNDEFEVMGVSLGSDAEKPTTVGVNTVVTDTTATSLGTTLENLPSFSVTNPQTFLSSELTVTGLGSGIQAEFSSEGNTASDSGIKDVTDVSTDLLTGHTTEANSGATPAGLLTTPVDTSSTFFSSVHSETNALTTQNLIQIPVSSETEITTADGAVGPPASAIIGSPTETVEVAANPFTASETTVTAAESTFAGNAEETSPFPLLLETQSSLTGSAASETNSPSLTESTLSLSTSADQAGANTGTNQTTFTLTSQAQDSLTTATISSDDNMLSPSTELHTTNVNADTTNEPETLGTGLVSQETDAQDLSTTRLPETFPNNDTDKFTTMTSLDEVTVSGHDTSESTTTRGIVLGAGTEGTPDTHTTGSPSSDVNDDSFSFSVLQTVAGFLFGQQTTQPSTGSALENDQSNSTKPVTEETTISAITVSQDSALSSTNVIFAENTDTALPVATDPSQNNSEVSLMQESTAAPSFSTTVLSFITDFVLGPVTSTQESGTTSEDFHSALTSLSSEDLMQQSTVVAVEQSTEQEGGVNHSPFAGTIVTFPPILSFETDSLIANVSTETASEIPLHVTNTFSEGTTPVSEAATTAMGETESTVVDITEIVSSSDNSAALNTELSFNSSPDSTVPVTESTKETLTSGIDEVETTTQADNADTSLVTIISQEASQTTIFSSYAPSGTTGHQEIVTTNTQENNFHSTSHKLDATTEATVISTQPLGTETGLPVTASDEALPTFQSMALTFTELESMTATTELTLHSSEFNQLGQFGITIQDASANSLESQTSAQETDKPVLDSATGVPGSAEPSETTSAIKFSTLATPTAPANTASITTDQTEHDSEKFTVSSATEGELHSTTVMATGNFNESNTVNTVTVQLFEEFTSELLTSTATEETTEETSAVTSNETVSEGLTESLGTNIIQPEDTSNTEQTDETTPLSSTTVVNSSFTSDEISTEDATPETSAVTDITITKEVADIIANSETTTDSLENLQTTIKSSQETNDSFETTRSVLQEITTVQPEAGTVNTTSEEPAVTRTSTTELGHTTTLASEPTSSGLTGSAVDLDAATQTVLSETTGPALSETTTSKADINTIMSEEMETTDGENPGLSALSTTALGEVITTVTLAGNSEEQNLTTTTVAEFSESFTAEQLLTTESATIQPPSTIVADATAGLNAVTEGSAEVTAENMTMAQVTATILPETTVNELTTDNPSTTTDELFEGTTTESLKAETTLFNQTTVDDIVATSATLETTANSFSTAETTASILSTVSNMLADIVSTTAGDVLTETTGSGELLSGVTTPSVITVPSETVLGTEVPANETVNTNMSSEGQTDTILSTVTTGDLATTAGVIPNNNTSLDSTNEQITVGNSDNPHEMVTTVSSALATETASAEPTSTQVTAITTILAEVVTAVDPVSAGTDILEQETTVFAASTHETSSSNDNAVQTTGNAETVAVSLTTVKPPTDLQTTGSAVESETTRTIDVTTNGLILTNAETIPTVPIQTATGTEPEAATTTETVLAATSNAVPAEIDVTTDVSSTETTVQDVTSATDAAETILSNVINGSNFPVTTEAPSPEILPITTDPMTVQAEELQTMTTVNTSTISAEPDTTFEVISFETSTTFASAPGIFPTMIAVSAGTAASAESTTDQTPVTTLAESTPPELTATSSFMAGNGTTEVSATTGVFSLEASEVTTLTHDATANKVETTTAEIIAISEVATEEDNNTANTTSTQAVSTGTITTDFDFNAEAAPTTPPSPTTAASFETTFVGEFNADITTISTIFSGGNAESFPITFQPTDSDIDATISATSTKPGAVDSTLGGTSFSPDFEHTVPSETFSEGTEDSLAHEVTTTGKIEDETTKGSNTLTPAATESLSTNSAITTPVEAIGGLALVETTTNYFEATISTETNHVSAITSQSNETTEDTTVEDISTETSQTSVSFGEATTTRTAETPGENELALSTTLANIHGEVDKEPTEATLQTSTAQFIFGQADLATTSSQPTSSAEGTVENGETTASFTGEIANTQLTTVVTEDVEIQDTATEDSNQGGHQTESTNFTTLSEASTTDTIHNETASTASSNEGELIEPATERPTALQTSSTYSLFSETEPAAVFTESSLTETIATSIHEFSQTTVSEDTMNNAIETTAEMEVTMAEETTHGELQQVLTEATTILQVNTESSLSNTGPATVVETFEDSTTGDPGNTAETSSEVTTLNPSSTIEVVEMQATTTAQTLENEVGISTTTLQAGGTETTFSDAFITETAASGDSTLAQSTAEGQLSSVSTEIITTQQPDDGTPLSHSITTEIAPDLTFTTLVETTSAETTPAKTSQITTIVSQANTTAHPTGTTVAIQIQDITTPDLADISVPTTSLQATSSEAVFSEFVTSATTTASLEATSNETSTEKDTQPTQTISETSTILYSSGATEGVGLQDTTAAVTVPAVSSGTTEETNKPITWADTNMQSNWTTEGIEMQHSTTAQNTVETLDPNSAFATTLATADTHVTFNDVLPTTMVVPTLAEITTHETSPTTQTFSESTTNLHGTGSTEEVETQATTTTATNMVGLVSTTITSFETTQPASGVEETSYSTEPLGDLATTLAVSGNTEEVKTQDTTAVSLQSDSNLLVTTSTLAITTSAANPHESSESYITMHSSQGVDMEETTAALTIHSTLTALVETATKDNYSTQSLNDITTTQNPSETTDEVGLKDTTTLQTTQEELSHGSTLQVTGMEAAVSEALLTTTTIASDQSSSTVVGTEGAADETSQPSSTVNQVITTLRSSETTDVNDPVTTVTTQDGFDQTSVTEATTVLQTIPADPSFNEDLATATTTASPDTTTKNSGSANETTFSSGETTTPLHPVVVTEQAETQGITTSKTTQIQPEQDMETTTVFQATVRPTTDTTGSTAELAFTNSLDEQSIETTLTVSTNATTLQASETTDGVEVQETTTAEATHSEFNQDSNTESTAILEPSSTGVTFSEASPATTTLVSSEIEEVAAQEITTAKTVQSETDQNMQADSTTIPQAANTGAALSETALTTSTTVSTEVHFTSTGNTAEEAFHTISVLSETTTVLYSSGAAEDGVIQETTTMETSQSGSDQNPLVTSTSTLAAVGTEVAPLTALLTITADMSPMETTSSETAETSQTTLVMSTVTTLNPSVTTEDVAVQDTTVKTTQSDLNSESFTNYISTTTHAAASTEEGISGGIPTTTTMASSETTSENLTNISQTTPIETTTPRDLSETTEDVAMQEITTAGTFQSEQVQDSLTESTTVLVVTNTDTVIASTTSLDVTNTEIALTESALTTASSQTTSTETTQANLSLSDSIAGLHPGGITEGYALQETMTEDIHSVSNQDALIASTTSLDVTNTEIALTETVPTTTTMASTGTTLAGNAEEVNGHHTLTLSETTTTLHSSESTEGTVVQTTTEKIRSESEQISLMESTTLLELTSAEVAHSEAVPTVTTPSIPETITTETAAEETSQTDPAPSETTTILLSSGSAGETTTTETIQSEEVDHSLMESTTVLEVTNIDLEHIEEVTTTTTLAATETTPAENNTEQVTSQYTLAPNETTTISTTTLHSSESTEDVGQETNITETVQSETGQGLLMESTTVIELTSTEMAPTEEVATTTTLATTETTIIENEEETSPTTPIPSETTTVPKTTLHSSESTEDVIVQETTTTETVPSESEQDALTEAITLSEISSTGAALAEEIPTTTITSTETTSAETEREETSQTPPELGETSTILHPSGSTEDVVVQETTSTEAIQSEFDHDSPTESTTTLELISTDVALTEAVLTTTTLASTETTSTKNLEEVTSQHTLLPSETTTIFHTSDSTEEVAEQEITTTETIQSETEQDGLLEPTTISEVSTEAAITEEVPTTTTLASTETINTQNEGEETSQTTLTPSETTTIPTTTLYSSESTEDVAVQETTITGTVQSETEQVALTGSTTTLELTSTDVALTEVGLSTTTLASTEIISTENSEVTSQHTLAPSETTTIFHTSESTEDVAVPETTLTETVQNETEQDALTEATTISEVASTEVGFAEEVLTITTLASTEITSTENSEVASQHTLAPSETTTIFHTSDSTDEVAVQEATTTETIQSETEQDGLLEATTIPEISTEVAVTEEVPTTMTLASTETITTQTEGKETSQTTLTPSETTTIHTTTLHSIESTEDVAVQETTITETIQSGTEQDALTETTTISEATEVAFAEEVLTTTTLTSTETISTENSEVTSQHTLAPSETTTIFHTSESTEDVAVPETTVTETVQNETEQDALTEATTTSEVTSTEVGFAEEILTITTLASTEITSTESSEVPSQHTLAPSETTTILLTSDSTEEVAEQETTTTETIQSETEQDGLLEATTISEISTEVAVTEEVPTATTLASTETIFTETEREETSQTSPALGETTTTLHPSESTEDAAAQETVTAETSQSDLEQDSKMESTTTLESASTEAISSESLSTIIATESLVDVSTTMTSLGVTTQILDSSDTTEGVEEHDAATHEPEEEIIASTSQTNTVDVTTSETISATTDSDATQTESTSSTIDEVSQITGTPGETIVDPLTSTVGDDLLSTFTTESTTYTPPNEDISMSEVTTDITSSDKAPTETTSLSTEGDVTTTTLTSENSSETTTNAPEHTITEETEEVPDTTTAETTSETFAENTVTATEPIPSTTTNAEHETITVESSTSESTDPTTQSVDEATESTKNFDQETTTGTAAVFSEFTTYPASTATAGDVTSLVETTDPQTESPTLQSTTATLLDGITMTLETEATEESHLTEQIDSTTQSATTTEVRIETTLITETTAGTTTEVPGTEMSTILPMHATEESDSSTTVIPVETITDLTQDTELSTLLHTQFFHDTTTTESSVNDQATVLTENEFNATSTGTVGVTASPVTDAPLVGNQNATEAVIPVHVLSENDTFITTPANVVTVVVTNNSLPGVNGSSDPNTLVVVEPGPSATFAPPSVSILNVGVDSGSVSSGSVVSVGSTSTSTTSSTSNSFLASILAAVQNAAPGLAVAGLFLAIPIVLLIALAFFGGGLGRTADVHNDLLLRLFNDMYEDFTLDQPWILAKILSQMFPDEFETDNHPKLLTQELVKMFPEQLQNLSHYDQVSIPYALISLFPQKFTNLNFDNLDSYIAEDDDYFGQPNYARQVLLDLYTAASKRAPSLMNQYLTTDNIEALKILLKDSPFIRGLGLNNDALDKIVHRFMTDSPIPDSEEVTPEKSEAVNNYNSSQSCKWGPLLCSLGRVTFQRGITNETDLNYATSNQPRVFPSWRSMTRLQGWARDKPAQWPLSGSASGISNLRRGVHGRLN